jgi:hypothetical protein
MSLDVKGSFTQAIIDAISAVQNRTNKLIAKQNAKLESAAFSRALKVFENAVQMMHLKPYV